MAWDFRNLVAEKTLKQSLDIVLSRFAVEVGDRYRDKSQNMDLYELQQKYLEKILEVIKEKLWTSTMMS